MNQKLQGILIRRRRLELGWSLSGLCGGICAVSHLSKIEQGKAEASSEVLSLLFARLGITWREEEGFCKDTEAFYENCYDQLFCGDPMPRLGETLEALAEQHKNSPFFLDWLLFTWVAEGTPPEDPELFVSAMDKRQMQLYLCLCGQFQELLRSSDQAFYLMEAGKRAYWKGNYGMAVSCLQRGVTQAAKEGCLPVLMECQVFLGNCYSSMNQLEQTREHYISASRMARSLHRSEEACVISYNQATTELQMGLVEDALRHLLEHPWNEALYFHKLAICYEKLNRKEDARNALDLAAKAPVSDLPNDPPEQEMILDEMLSLIRFRLDDPQYLKNPAYGALLQKCIHSWEKELPLSFLRFHAPWLEEWYIANRQYRQAYETLKRFS